MNSEEIDEVIEAMALDDPNTCFDCWHRHADGDRDGNNDLEKRKSSIQDLINFYSVLKNRLTSFHKPYQLWIWILEGDGGQDAVFFNAPHPKNTTFPITIDGTNDFTTKNVDLRKYIEGLGFEIIPDIYEGELQYYLFDKRTGIPLSKE